MKRTLSVITLALFSFQLIFSTTAFASADTTDGKHEIFYEWVEYYNFSTEPDPDVPKMTDQYYYDYSNSGSQREYINYHPNDAPPATSNVVENFVNTLKSSTTLDAKPWYVNDYYTNDGAMERDWDYLERASYNIETADIAVYGGHGIDGKSMQFNRMYSDSHLTHADADFGYNDLDWVFLFTCNWLFNRTRVENNKVLGGAHSIMGYGTTMYMDPRMSTYLAQLLTGTAYAKMNVRQAWHEMNRLFPGPNTSINNATTSVVYGASVDYNDYIWGEGSVGPYPGNNPTSFWSPITYTTIPTNSPQYGQ